MTASPAQRRWVSVLLSTALLAGATACTPPAGPQAPAPTGAPTAGSTAPDQQEQPEEQPVAIVPGTRPDEQLLAVVLQRHLENHGIPAEVGEPSAEPWGAAGAHQVAVVDTLAMATHLVPEALVGQGPTTAASPGASATGTEPGTESPGPSATASPSPSDAAPASPTGHPTATGSATPLPEGRPAADAQGTTAMITEHLPEDVEVLGASAGTMRLQAVATTALTGLYDLTTLTDLNELCDRLVFSPASAEAVHGERLDELAGCVPAEWVEPGKAGMVTDLVSGRADVVLLYGTDPAIPDRALEPLDDPARILPEGRFLMVADPEALPDGTRGALEAVAGRLDGTMIAELGRLSRGPDRLPREEAAQFWLVSAGLEERPAGWF